MKTIKHKKSTLVLLISVIMMFSGVAIYADDFVVDPFRITSEDGSKVFIYTPNPHFNRRRDSRLPATGLYYNTDPLELIYLLDDIGWAFENDFFFSPDFRHLAFFRELSFDIALEFYEDGILIKRYMIDDLVKNMNEVWFSTSSAHWAKRASRNFDTTNNILTVTTVDNLTHVFDIKTGETINGTVGDTPSSWAQESVERASDLGLLPDSFRYGFEKNTTRAEFAAIAIALYEHFREPVTGRITFTDTNDSNVERVAYLGIATGVGNNRFDPNSPLTREQAAVMLANLAEALGHPLVPLPTSPPGQSLLLTDHSYISSWAVLDVEQVYAAGIMGSVDNGISVFAPQQPYTREQSIVTIMRLFDMVK